MTSFTDIVIKEVGSFIMDRSMAVKQVEGVARLEGRLQKVFNQTAREITKQVKASGGLTTRSRGVIDAEFDAFKKKMNEELMQNLDKYGVEQALADQVFTASDRTTERLIGNVMDNIRASERAGLGIDDVAKNLQKEFIGMEDHELQRIARMQVHGAQQRSRFEENNADPDVEFHQWVSAEDERTRDSHLEMNGQITRVGEPFSNGLLYPGDSSGPIEEWINCRCRLVPWVLPPGMAVPAGKSDDPGPVMAVKYFYEEDLEPVAMAADAEEIKSTDDIFENPPDWSKYKGMSAKDAKAYGTTNLRGLMAERGLTDDVINAMSGQDLRAVARNPGRLPEILEKIRPRVGPSKVKPPPVKKPVKPVKKPKAPDTGTGTFANSLADLQSRLPVFEEGEDYGKKLMAERMIGRTSYESGVPKAHKDIYARVMNEFITEDLPLEHSQVLVKHLKSGMRLEKAHPEYGGVYNFEERVVTLYAKTLGSDPKMKRVMVHELAHALDDAYHISSYFQSMQGVKFSETYRNLKGINKVKDTVAKAWRKQQKGVYQAMKRKGKTYFEWQETRFLGSDVHQVSAYSNSGIVEFWAESVMDFVTNGGHRVKDVDENLYNVIRDFVFKGKEFAK